MTFIYQVNGYEFEGQTAWGDAWKQAKAKARELHTGIFREVYNTKTEERKREFYARGCFLPIDLYSEEDAVIL